MKYRFSETQELKFKEMDGTQTSEETSEETRETRAPEKYERRQDADSGIRKIMKSIILWLCGGRHKLHLDCMPLWAHLGNEVGNNNKQSFRDLLVNVK